MEETATPVAHKFELMIIISPDVVDKDKALDEIRNTIAEIGGSIFQEDIHGLRDLAYRIKKQDKGFYAVFYFDLSDPSKLGEMDKAFNISQDVLRHMTIKFNKHYQIVTLAEYDEEIEKIKEERAQKAEKKALKSRMSRAKKTSKPAPAKKPQEPEAKPEETAEAPKAAEAPEAETKAEESTPEEKAPEAKEVAADKLKAVDEKLKSIIDDPDITL